MNARLHNALPGRKKVLVAAMALALAGGVLTNMAPPVYAAASATTATARGNPQFADIVENVQPAVVNISVSHAAESTNLPEGFPNIPEFAPFFKQFRGHNQMPMQSMPSESLGSGFIVSRDGYVVTNLHVVGDGQEITVTTDGGDQYPAELVGSDPRTDLALLKITADKPLPYVSFGDSSRVRVGDWVVAIGNPFGLGGSVSAGIVSARGRDINSGPYDNYLQIDAPINRGNSGGPLFDTEGNVIGVNTAIFSPNGGNIGIGFAIPAETANEVVLALMENGTVARGWLGVHIQPVTDDLAENLSLPETAGAMVVEVVPGSPAAATDLRSGDVILGVNNEAISDARTLSRTIGSIEPGTRIQLKVWRDGRARNIPLTLGNLAAAEQPLAHNTPPAQPENDAALGLTLAPLDRSTRGNLDPTVTNGVVVTNVAPDSIAAKKQVFPGDVIVSIDQSEVANVDEALAHLAMAKASHKHSVLLLLAREDQRRYVALPIS